MKKILEQIFTTKAAKAAKDSYKLTAWLLELNDIDDLAALKMCTQKLTTLFDEPGTSTQQKLDLMMEIETINQLRLEKLATQFVSVANMKLELEREISETCYEYCRQSYIFHLKMIELTINTNELKLSQNNAALLIARAINAAFNMTKWRMFLQQHAPTKMWLQTYALYNIAQQQNLHTQLVELFPLSPNTTLSAFVMQLCMLGHLQQANMQKHHVEISSRLLRAWLTRGNISAQHTPSQQLFYIDLAQDMPAKRMRVRNFEPNEHCRFWDLDELEKQLKVGITVTERDEMPQSLMFAKIDNLKKLNETLTILLTEWKKQGYLRQRRREARQATSKTTSVRAGIAEICEQVLHANQVKAGLKPRGTGKSLNQLLSSQTALKIESDQFVATGSLDSWIITDESQHGIGARVNKYANVLARVDKLIGIVPDDDISNVIIGFIKGVKSTQANQLKVGIEVLSREPIWVQLQLAQQNSSFLDTIAEVNASHYRPNIDIGMFTGIYLPAESGLSQTASLILPKIHYRPSTKYIVHIAGKHKRGVLGQPFESRDDWVRIAVTL